jgi:hypothetical protein
VYNLLPAFLGVFQEFSQANIGKRVFEQAQY